jgi:hypothetical protein
MLTEEGNRIEVARQEQLTRCLATTPDVTRGIYPFIGR